MRDGYFLETQTCPFVTSTTHRKRSLGFSPKIDTTMAGTVTRSDLEFVTLGIVFWQTVTASRVRTGILG